MGPESRLSRILQRLGLELPPPPEPKGLYRPLVVVGNLAYTSGHLPVLPSGDLITGRLGQDLDEKAGYEAALRAGLAVLATLRHRFETLDRVRRVVKTLGVVNCTPDFHQHPAVINGCSQLFADVFGPDNGIGARSAFGVAALPANVPVEIEAIFEIEG
jgi:enamine deaminase RidA (YjgF/YER057c/UK114 family)